MPSSCVASGSRGSLLCLNLLLTVLLLASPLVRAQTRVNDRDLEAMMRNLSSDTKAFRPVFENDVRKKSIIRGTSQAKDAVNLMQTFARQTEELPKRFKKDRNGGDSFRVVQSTALQVDATIGSAQLNSEVRDRWKKIRGEVNQIAAAYNIPPPFGPGQAATSSVPAAAMPLPTDASSQWVPIEAFATRPLQGAHVAIYNLKGKRIFEQKSATNERGVFPASVRHLPRDFRVMVTSDGAGLRDVNFRSMGSFTLCADVRNFDSTNDIVYVNPVTTLACKIVDRESGHDLAQAQQRVREVLGLPQDATFGPALRQSNRYQNPYFSETLFLAQARQDGGLDQFIEGLAREAASGRSKPQPFYDARADPITASVVFKYLGDKLLGGLFAFGVNSAGWAITNSLTVQKNATKKDIEGLQQQLEDVQSSLAMLYEQIDNLGKKLDTKLDEIQYRQVVIPAGQLSIRIRSTEDNLVYFADECPPYPGTEDTSRRQKSDRDYCTKRKTTLYKQTQDLDPSFNELSAFILDNKLGPRTNGIVHLYSRVLGQSVRFFRPAESTELDEISVYWMGVLTESANLKLEFLHEDNAQTYGITTLTAFGGDPRKVPPTDGAFQKNLAELARLTFPAMPRNTVINTTDRTMWLILPLVMTRDVYGESVTCAMPPRGSIMNYPASSPIEIGGLEWRSPTADQARNLLMGWSGGDANQWLTANTKAETPADPTSPGFPDYVTRKPRRIGCGLQTAATPFAWTRDPVQGKQNLYYVLNMRDGSVTGELQSGSYRYEILSRVLQPGEQYYFYPGQ